MTAVGPFTLAAIALIAVTFLTGLAICRARMVGPASERAKARRKGAMILGGASAGGCALVLTLAALNGLRGPDVIYAVGLTAWTGMIWSRLLRPERDHDSHPFEHAAVATMAVGLAWSIFADGLDGLAASSLLVLVVGQFAAAVKGPSVDELDELWAAEHHDDDPVKMLTRKVV